MASCLAQLHETEETLEDVMEAWQVSPGCLLRPISLTTPLAWCNITGGSPGILSGAVVACAA